MLNLNKIQISSLSIVSAEIIKMHKLIIELYKRGQQNNPWQKITKIKVKRS